MVLARHRVLELFVFLVNLSFNILSYKANSFLADFANRFESVFSCITSYGTLIWYLDKNAISFPHLPC